MEQGFFVRKYHMQLTQVMSVKERSDAIAARNRAVEAQLKALKHIHGSGKQLLEHCGVQA